MNAPAIDLQAVDYRLEHVARLAAGAHELVIRIAACGICASDCKCHAFPLTDWERAFALANSLDSIKVLLRP